MRLFSWIAVCMVALSVGLVAVGDEITFMSTQMRPIEEAEWVRGELLPPFSDLTGIGVVFLGAEEPEMATRVLAEYEAQRGTLHLVGDLHANFMVYTEALTDLSGHLAELEAIGDRTLAPAFVDLGVMDGIQAYIPWMQATYIMVANKKALPYMPPGVMGRGLTYDLLLRWAINLYEATGEPKLGIPSGPRALIHRFLHGYAYPSFTGAQVKNFNTPEAVAMWEQLVELWEYVHPGAATLDAIDTALLTEEVWLAWDHTARVRTAVSERPEDFIALPSPAGPMGRGVITVLAGLGIPETSPDKEAAYRLIEYLTAPDTQVSILEGVGFFPVVDEAAGAVPTGGLKILADGVSAQSAAPDLLVSIIPGGFGPRVGEFGKIYTDTFTEIVLMGRPIQDVLDRQGALLDELYEDTGAPLPLPDAEL